MDKKYKKLLSNTAILGIGTFGSKVLVFLLMPLYTAYLSSAQYGSADIISQSANLLMPLISLGICEAVFRFALDSEYDRSQVLSCGLTIIIAGAAVAYILFPLLNLIAYFEGYMWLIILYAFSANLHSLFAQYIRACGMTTFFAVQGMISTALTIALNILFLVVMNMGVLGYVLSVVISDFVVSVIIFAIAKLYRQIRFKKINFDVMRYMLKFSIPLIPTTVFWWITNVSDRYMIKGFIGDSVNGLYAAAFKIPTLLILLSGIFIEAWQFSAVTERDTEGRSGHIIFFGRVFNSFQGMLFMAGASLIALSKIFSMVLFDSSYYTAWQYMPLLVAATVYSSIVTFLGSVYLVDKKSVQSLLTSMVGAVVNLVLNFILIPTSLGAIGAALATFFSYFVVFIIRAINTRRYIPFDLHIPKLVINTVIIGIQIAFINFELPLWIPVQIAGIAAIAFINIKPILDGVLKLLKRR